MNIKKGIIGFISPNIGWYNEVLHMVNQYMRGIPVTSEALAVDLIDRIGPGGHYLEEEHTRRHFRDVWYSELFDRTNYDEWFKNGARRFKERLSEKTRKLMDLNSQPLPTKIVKEMDRMEKQWRDESGHWESYFEYITFIIQYSTLMNAWEVGFIKCFVFGIWCLVWNIGYYISMLEY